MKNSLRFQLLFRSLLVLAALLALIGIFQYLFMQNFIYKNTAESIQNQILSVPREIWTKIALNPPENEFDRPPFLFMPDTSLAFIDVDGNFTLLSDFHKKNVSPPKFLSGDYQNALHSRAKLNYQIVKDPQGAEQLVVLQPMEFHGRMLGVIQVSTSTAPLKEVLVQQVVTFLSLSLLALLAGLLAFLPVLKKTLVPLSKMVNTVEQIDAGKLNERLPTRQGQMEIDRLAVSFNGMLERLEESFQAEKEAKEQMRRFVADASHELRTPLTSIHGFLEVLLRGAMNHPDQLKKALTSMYGESERINKLVEDLLLLAKLDRAPHIELAEGDLKELIWEMEPQLRLLAGNRNVELEMAEDARCNYNPDKMKQVILNLFHNAVQHTESENGRIAIILESTFDGIQLSVKDNGLGIAKEHLSHVFDRFYRSESSRTRKYGGAGLGLSITKSIVEAHGGTIQAESQEGEGSTFTVRLPSSPN